MSKPQEIHLGNHVAPVYAQRHAYLVNRLGRFINHFVQDSADLGTDRLLSYGQETIYKLLCVLVPQLEKRMPEFEFRGFGSKEAMEKNEYDPELDNSPTIPEVRTALETIARVNGFDVVKHLARVVDPSLLRGMVNQQIAQQILTTSPSSPSESGVSDSTSSTTKPRTNSKSVV